MRAIWPDDPDRKVVTVREQFETTLLEKMPAEFPDHRVDLTARPTDEHIHSCFDHTISKLSDADVARLLRDVDVSKIDAELTALNEIASLTDPRYARENGVRQITIIEIEDLNQAF